MWYYFIVRKNPHAVALGRRGGLAGGRKGGVARALALSPERRREIARQAASARWAPTTPIRADAVPSAVRRLLKTYDPSQLRWNDATDRWAIVSAILVRGSEEARDWLRARLSSEELRELARQFHGAGLNEPDRARLRAELDLDEEEIPPRPFLGFDWGDGGKT